jgi:hypothetical protein
MTAAARVPCFHHAAYLPDPGHGHRRAGLKNDNRMWIRSSHLLDQGFLIVGKCEGCQIHAFRLPLVGEDDCDIGAPSQSCGGRRVLAWVELYLSVRELRPQSFERRRGEPDVVLPVSRALSWRRNRIASGRIDLG